MKYWLVALALVWSSCSKKADDITGPGLEPKYPPDSLTGPWTDTLSFATYNMAIGFDITSLIFIDPNNTDTVYSALSKIRQDYFANLPLERVKIMGRVIAEEQPDIIGLQEVMAMEWNDTAHSDFIPQLLAAIEASGGPDYRAYWAPLNDTILAVDASAGKLKVRFVEGNAVLYKAEFEVTDSATQFFNSYFKSRGFSAKRAFNQVDLKKGSLDFQIFNTHLEVPLIGLYQINQATELRTHMNRVRMDGVPQILLGDFNGEPGSTVYSTFITAGWRDAYSAVNDDKGGTCCVSGLLTDPNAAFSNRRIDYVFLRGDAKSIDAEVLLGERFATEAGDSLYAADHFMVKASVAVK